MAGLGSRVLWGWLLGSGLGLGLSQRFPLANNLTSIWFLPVNLFACIYCFLTGIYLAIGWQNPFPEADPKRLARAVTAGGGLSGLILRVVER